jgi:hypothetical protein
MKSDDILLETTTTLIDEYGKRCIIHINPSFNEIQSKLSTEHMRVILFFGLKHELFIWSYKQMIHSTVITQLGIPFESCVCMDWSYVNRTLEPTITTLYSKPSWFYNFSQFMKNPLIIRAFGENVKYISPKPIIDEDTGDDLYAWFGDSKVIDTQGDPLVVYHGTNTNFKEFKKWSHFGTKKAANQRLKNKKDGANIIPVYLKIENPLILTDGEANDPAILRDAVLSGKYDAIYPDLKQWASNWRMTLEKLGYDGIFYKNSIEDPGNWSYIVFRPDQVRHIFNN